MTEDIEFQSVEAIKDFQEKKLREAWTIWRPIPHITKECFPVSG